MKLGARDIPGFIAKPDLSRAGVLIYGQDAMRVAIKRKALVDAIVGPDGETEMRLTRIPGSDLRKDSGAAIDAVKAVGFFPGPRVVLVEDATDATIKALTAVLEDWRPGDAMLVVTAGNLSPRAKIRKLFEGMGSAVYMAIYNDPPTQAEVAATLAKAGITQVDPDAQAAIEAFAKTLDPGDFAQLIEKIGLYTLRADGPVTVTDIDACAPQSTEAALDDVLHVVADARTADLTQVLGRLTAQGSNPTGICIAAMRHFKLLHAAASHPGGPAQGIGQLRPPVYGPRRDRMLRQAQNWGRHRLEQAISMLLETDQALRSAGQTAPQMAVMERSLIRISMLGRM